MVLCLSKVDLLPAAQAALFFCLAARVSLATVALCLFNLLLLTRLLLELCLYLAVAQYRAQVGLLLLHLGILYSAQRALLPYLLAPAVARASRAAPCLCLLALAPLAAQ